MNDESATESAIDALDGVRAAELLLFYRKKIVACEDERVAFLRRLGDLAAQNAEQQKMMWAVRAREEEVEELQNAVSDCKLFLYDEREQLLRLKAENDDLKAQEVEDRVRIQQLLALTAPGGGASADAAPVHPRAAARRAAAAGDAPSSSRSSAARGTASGAEEDALVAGLRQQLEDARALAAARAAAMAQDRADMREQYARRADADAATVRRLEAGLAASQTKVAELMREYLLQRHQSGVSERQAAEELATLRASSAELEARLAAAQSGATQQMATALRAADENLRAQKLSLATRLHVADGELAARGALHEARAGELEAEVRHLRAKLATVQQRYDSLEVRRSREIEGFNTDIALLRGALRQLEGQWAHIAAVGSEAPAITAAAVAAAAAGTTARYAAEGGEARPAQRRRSTSGSRANASGGASAASGGGVEIVPPVRHFEVPAMGAMLPADEATFARLRAKGALLRDRPVLYRSTRSSGYGAAGQRSFIRAQDINEAARGSGSTDASAAADADFESHAGSADGVSPALQARFRSLAAARAALAAAEDASDNAGSAGRAAAAAGGSARVAGPPRGGPDSSSSGSAGGGSGSSGSRLGFPFTAAEQMLYSAASASAADGGAARRLVPTTTTVAPQATASSPLAALLRQQQQQRRRDDAGSSSSSSGLSSAGSSEGSAAGVGHSARRLSGGARRVQLSAAAAGRAAGGDASGGGANSSSGGSATTEVRLEATRAQIAALRERVRQL